MIKLLKYFFVLFCLLTPSLEVIGKAIPPGTGEADIKNNILFMLDYSDNMKECSGLQCADNKPTDISIGYNGDIYVIAGEGAMGGIIYHYDSLGVFQGKMEVKTSALYMYGCGMDPSDDTDKYIYCADWGQSWIAKICTGRVLDSDCAQAGEVVIKKTVSSPLDIAVDSTGSYLISSNCNGVRKYTLPDMIDTGQVQENPFCPDYVTFGEGDHANNWFVTRWVSDDTRMYNLDMNQVWQNTTCRNSESTAYSGGYLYVTERGHGYVCKIDADDGSIAERYGDGEGTGNLQFNNAWGGYTDPTTKNIYIADTGNRRVQEMNADGEWIKTFDTGDPTKLAIGIAAIQKVINDAEINESSNFGLMAFNRDNEGDKTYWLTAVDDQGKSDIGQYLVTNLNSPNNNLHSNYGFTDCSPFWGATQSTISLKGFNKTGTPVWIDKDFSSPSLPNTASCQKNFNVLLIASTSEDEINAAEDMINNLVTSSENVKTFVVVMGSSVDVDPSIHNLAIAGNTGPSEDPPNPKKPGVMFAHDLDSLAQKLREALRTATNAKLTFASPTIDIDYSTEGTEETYIMQATFEYQESGPWIGKLSKYKIQSGAIATTPTWKAHELLNLMLPRNRKIFTVEDTGGSTDMEVQVSESSKSNQWTDGAAKYLNNFHSDNSELLKDKMCQSECDERDIKNIINYIRGYDTYDENENCTADLTAITNSALAYNTVTDSCIGEVRGLQTHISATTNLPTYKLFDIYHSKPVIVDPPSAPAFAFSENSETKYRHVNGYNNFKVEQELRDKIVLVGSNGGLVHAFNYSTGTEEWAFVPPSLLNKFVTTLSPRKHTYLSGSGITDSATSITVIDASQFPSSGVVRIGNEYIYYTSKTNTTINGATRGYNSSTAASHANESVVYNVSTKQSVISSMYGVDGSAVVKDIFSKDNGCENKTWKTIAIIPMGRGGQSYTALDITDTQKPYHLFTFENDTSQAQKTAVLWFTEYTRNAQCTTITGTRTYKREFIYDTPQVSPVGLLTAAIGTTDTSFAVDDASGYRTTQCPQKCIIQIDDEIMNYETITGNVFSGVTRQQPNDENNPNSTNATHAINASVRQAATCGENNTAKFNLTQDTLKYDYSGLGQAWGTPDINLLDLEDGGAEKRWVSILSGGFNGASDCNTGSVIYLINLENYTGESNVEYIYGTVAKKINIPGSDRDIPNSIPGDLTVITDDSSALFNMGAGALVYFADINNRLWKVNLLKSSIAGGTFGEKKLLYEDEVTFAKDNRNFQRVLATIDESNKYDAISYDDGILRLYYGTGNTQSVGKANLTIQNAIYGLIDHEFPKYGTEGTSLLFNSIVDTTTPLYDITECFIGNDPSYTGGNAPQYDCPDLGINSPGWKVDLDQGERVVGEKPLLTGGYVYFSIYEPDILDSCTPGDASIGIYDYMCPAGATTQIKLGQGLLTSAESDGEFVYFGQSNVSNLEGDRGTVKSEATMGTFTDEGSSGGTKAEELAQSVGNVDEDDSGSLGRLGVAEESKTEVMGRSWRELR